MRRREWNFPGGGIVLSVMIPSRARQRVVSGLLFLGCMLLAQTSLAEDRDMKCDGSLPSTHIALTQNDHATANHLELNRQLGDKTSVTLDICTADLTIRNGTDNQLMISLNAGKVSPQKDLVEYVQILDADPTHATLRLHLPKDLQAKVVLVLPASTPGLEVNLNHGIISLEADKLESNRIINLASGAVKFYGNTDSYHQLNANIALGALHDHRQGGKNHHFIVSRSLSGTGNGNVEINLAKGSVNLFPPQAKLTD